MNLQRISWGVQRLRLFDGKRAIRTILNRRLNFLTESGIRIRHQYFDVVVGPVGRFYNPKDFRGRVFAHAVPLTEVKVREYAHVYFSRRT